MTSSLRTQEIIIPPIYTFLDFLRNPHTYDSLASQKKALWTLIPDERVVEDFADVISSAPAKILLDDELAVSAKNSIHTKVLSARIYTTIINTM